MARRYHPETIKRALNCYAITGGNEQRTKDLLEAAGLGAIPFATVRGWRSRTHREYYEQIRTDVEEQIGSELADDHLNLAFAAGENERLAMGILREKLLAGEVTAKEAARIAKDSGVTMAIHTDKHQILSGKPTVIVQNDFADLQKALEQRHGVKLVIEGEAVEEEIPALPEGAVA